MMKRLFGLLLVIPASLPAAGGQAGASPQEIMSEVAAHQDQALKLRESYVYQQHIRIVTRRTNGRLAREETADYVVTPTAEGTKKELKSITGRYWHKGSYHVFQGEPRPESHSLDGDLIKDLRDDLANDQSRDGIGRHLFPLTSEEQKKYQFEPAGEETAHGQRAYRVRFRPRQKGDVTWAGEALIDAEEFQPLSVFTHLSRRIPFAVRTLLGTDLPGVGFNVEYRRFDDGVWFPVSFGTEFRLRALFFINREITISLENSGFQRAHVETKITPLGPTP
jgi:hypothetical protein